MLDRVNHAPMASSPAPAVACALTFLPMTMHSTVWGQKMGSCLSHFFESAYLAGV